MKNIILILFVFVVGISVGESGRYRVIVNKSNITDTLTKEEVAGFFLKKVMKWENGMKVLPVDLNAQSEIRKKFSVDIIGETVGEVRSYWQQYVFSGQGTPPVEKKTDTDVIDYVKTHPGAIGYVSVECEISEVKVLSVE